MGILRTSTNRIGITGGPDNIRSTPYQSLRATPRSPSYMNDWESTNYKEIYDNIKILNESGFPPQTPSRFNNAFINAPPVRTRSSSSVNARKKNKTSSGKRPKTAVNRQAPPSAKSAKTAAPYPKGKSFSRCECQKVMDQVRQISSEEENSGKKLCCQCRRRLEEQCIQLSDVQSGVNSSPRDRSVSFQHLASADKRPCNPDNERRRSQSSYTSRRDEPPHNDAVPGKYTKISIII